MRFFLLLRSLGVPLTPPPPFFSSVMMTIDGIVIKPLDGWEVTETINAQSNFRFTLRSEDGSYRPASDQKVLLYENGVLLFGGLISETSERGVGGEPIVPIDSPCVAHDFMKYVHRRQDVNEIIPAGTLKEALMQLMPYMPEMTLDPTQADGPELNDLAYEDAALQDVLNDLSLNSGYNVKASFEEMIKMAAPADEPAPFNITQSNGMLIKDVTVDKIPVKYANRVIARSNNGLRSVYNNIPEQTAKGYIQSVVVQAADVADQLGLDTFAQKYGEKAIVLTKRVKYTTRQAGFHPGQTQTITLARRGLSGTFLITEVKTRRVENVMWRTITAVEGNTRPDDFRDDYRKWSGGGATAGVKGGGGGGGGRSEVILSTSDVAVRAGAGGAGDIWGDDVWDSDVWDPDVWGDVLTWVPATGGSEIMGQGSVHARVNTAETGTSFEVTARIRALDEGVTVQARLWNVSLSEAVPGVSPPVTSTLGADGKTQWTSVSWNVVLQLGDYSYELQLLSDTSNADMQATARMIPN